MKPNETFKSFIQNGLKRVTEPVFCQILANETFFQVLTAKSTFFYNCKNYCLGKNLSFPKIVRL